MKVTLPMCATNTKLSNYLEIKVLITSQGTQLVNSMQQTLMTSPSSHQSLWLRMNNQSELCKVKYNAKYSHSSIFTADGKN